MKSLAIIWAAALVSGIGTLAYVNAEIDKLVVNEPFTVVSEVKEPYNPQLTVKGNSLQPAGTVSGNFTTTYNPQQTAPASVLNTATEIQ